MNTNQSLKEGIVAAGQFLFSQGWSPATSSNYSSRLDANQLLITESGKHKGFLTPDDIMHIDYQGQSLEAGRKPSAETLLHTHLYQRFEGVQSVLHTHSVNATVLTMKKAHFNELTFHGYEMQKAFAGVTSHEEFVTVPVFDNTQDIASLANEVDQYLDQHPNIPGYLIRGHGLYTWGQSMSECLRHVEAFEFLLACELKSLSLG